LAGYKPGTNIQHKASTTSGDIANLS